MPRSPASQIRTFRLDAPCRRVLDFFTPLGERAWAEGWNPQMLSGEKERGSVFRTQAHGAKTLWIVTDYRPDEGRIGYARLKEGSHFGLVDVECRDRGADSEIAVRYTLTGVSEEGDAFVREFLDTTAYARFIDEWRTSIDALLSHGGDAGR